MTKIVCVSDQHGYLENDIPPCDLLLIAGDIMPTYDHSVPFQKEWLLERYFLWLDNQPFKEAVIVGGNHDFLFESHEKICWPYKVHYLEDTSCVVDGLKIHGTPWALNFGPWAFMDTENELEIKYNLIEDDVDIIVSHTPMNGFGDRTVSGEYAGSTRLRAKINQIKPKLLVCGHIHEGYGSYRKGDTYIINASIMNEFYEPINDPVEIEI